MKPRLLTPGRAAIIGIPILGFFSTPFWTFAQEPTLWLGLPAVLVWIAIAVFVADLLLAGRRGRRIARAALL